VRLVLISDTHNRQNLDLPPGDVLVHAGDATGRGTLEEVERFLAWFAAQPHRRKVFIAGNHDWLFERDPAAAARLLQAHPGLDYLQDSGLEIDGIRFWGSPWQPEFCAWAFNLPRQGEQLRQAWNRIPPGAEVLITHGPPHGILDQVGGGEHLGCEELRLRLAAVRPRLHVFGHIHDGYGAHREDGTLFVNASTCDEGYHPVNAPVVVEVSGARAELAGPITA
jgi:predicted phosphohydrolase